MKPKELINLGAFVFPLEKNGKAPAHKGWQEESTQSLSQIQKWVDEGHNLGIDTGKSGLFVVDVDNKNGKNGSATWQKWTTEAGNTPGTLTFRTASGGYHLVFRDPTGELKNRTAMDVGLDARGQGGFIVAPGSTIDGKAYTKINEFPIADVPEWVRGKVVKEKFVAAANAVAIPEDRIDDDDLVEAAIEVLECAAPATMGDAGDDHTFKLACTVKDIGISREMCLELMAEHWNDRCDPPWRLGGPGPDQSLQDKVWSAYSSGQNAIGVASTTATAALAFKDYVTPPEQTYEAQAAAAGFDPVMQAPPALDPLKFVNVDTMSAFIRKGHELPPAKPLFSELMFEKEATILFSDMGVGKTALGMQIARALASGTSVPGFPNESPPLRVLYCDFELSTRQLANRYEDDGHFPPNLMRLELNAHEIPPGMSTADAIMMAIPLLIEKYGFEVLIVDNLTYLGEDLTQVEEAAHLMKGLKGVKDHSDAAQLIIAHTPKRKEFEPLSINDLGGSRMIPNFADAVFAIGKVKGDETLRYFKQLKVRSAEVKYGASNVPMCRLAKREGLLGFEFIECRREADLIKGEVSNVPKKDEKFESFLELAAVYQKPGPPNTLRRVIEAMIADHGETLGSSNRMYERVKANFESKAGTNNRVAYSNNAGLIIEVFCDNARLKHITGCSAHFGVQVHDEATYGGPAV